MTLAFKAAHENIILLGSTKGWLGASTWLAEITGREDGAPPPVDLALEKQTGELVLGLIRDGKEETVKVMLKKADDSEILASALEAIERDFADCDRSWRSMSYLLTEFKIFKKVTDIDF